MTLPMPHNLPISLCHDTQARTCPLCRATSHFVTPSTVWPTSAEQKDAIIDGYKAKLATIDCRNFNFGACSFSITSIYSYECITSLVDGRRGWPARPPHPANGA